MLILTLLKLRHIQALTRVLAVIKRPYLNVEVNELLSLKDASSVVDLMEDGAQLASLKHLTSQQRDQVDLQAKMIISRCAERVRAMEQVEKSKKHCFLAIPILYSSAISSERTRIVEIQQTLTPITRPSNESRRLFIPALRLSCGS